MKNSIASIVVAAAALSLNTGAQAGTVALNQYTNTSPPADTRALGSATDSTVTVDGTHTLVKLQTTDTPAGYVNPDPSGANQEKAAPFFYSGSLTNPLTPIGTLGDLSRGSLTFDWKHESGTDVYPTPAIRLLVSGVNGDANQFAEIVWESAYQPAYSTPNSPFPVGGSVNDLNAGAGNFWVRYAGQNYAQGDNGPGQSLTLADWASGTQFDAAHNWPTFGDNSQIYGLTTSVGSQAGDYVGYVGDINATFTAVPEPSTIAIFGLGAIGLLMRRRRAVR